MSGCGHSEALVVDLSGKPVVYHNGLPATFRSLRGYFGVKRPVVLATWLSRYFQLGLYPHL